MIMSLRLPVVFVTLLWLIKGFELITHADLSILGNYPRKVYGIMGVFSSPLVHGEFGHLMSNSVPIIILGTLVLFFYPIAAKKVILGVYIFSGIAVWLLARPVYHIGASGIVYGLAFFLFFSGVFRNDIKSLAISFFIIFMYGGIVWGLAPNVVGVSWESHLFGGIVGSLLAYHYRYTDLPPKVETVEADQQQSEINYRYIYIPKDEKGEPKPELDEEGTDNNY